MNKMLESFFVQAERELERATKEYGPLINGHEAYAVILEELDEFWKEVKKKQPDRVNMRKELIQIAAMVKRTYMDLDL